MSMTSSRSASTVSTGRSATGSSEGSWEREQWNQLREEEGEGEGHEGSHTM